MGKSAHGLWVEGRRRLAACLPLFVLAAAALLVVSPGTARAGGGKVLWHSRDQFVAIERQDDAGEKTPANDHPAQLSAEQLRSMLASPQIADGSAKGPLPVFNEPEREVLVEFIREGLNLAGPGEDVTFAVTGQFRTLLGLVSESKVTTGRVYFQGGELNIIFGMVHRDFRENEDRRLAPFVPGSRNRPAELAGKITSLPGGHPFTMKRADWLAFSPAGQGRAPALPEKAAKPPQEQGSPPQTDTQPGRGEKKGKTVTERLLLLNELRERKLISDEEYRAKRLEILNEL